MVVRGVNAERLGSFERWEGTIFILPGRRLISWPFLAGLTIFGDESVEFVNRGGMRRGSVARLPETGTAECGQGRRILYRNRTDSLPDERVEQMSHFYV